ncbi:DUF2726 domain-containing protein [Microvirga sp. 2YAF29]|uniref:DUF2726 domain-containing protein n=1 Tax=Microvirga sp. 2YAF29 TaxID=3233031 RepID=UPI003F951FF1
MVDWQFGQGAWIGLAGIVMLALLMVLYLSWARRPRFKRCTVMTANEREFYQRILKACPDCEIWPQVPLLALVRPEGREGSRAFWTAFRQISNTRVDWVIAQDTEVLAVIELDDRSHDAKRDARRDDILKGCGYRVLRFQSKNRPEPQQIHDAIFTGR